MVKPQEEVKKKPFYTMGSKKENAKEINVDINFKTVTLFILFIALIQITIFFAIEPDVQGYQFKCTDGTVEDVLYKKTNYCGGQHYTEVFQYLSEDQREGLTNVILYNTTNGE